MSEGDIVNATEGLPATVDSMTHELTELGLKSGMVVIVHSSLRNLGWIVGGAQAVLMALDNIIGPEGTIVMPAFTSGNGEPSGWSAPPVPESWWQIIRDHQPAYDPDISPTREIGAVAETFRKMPGTMRSNHPTHSFCARGPLAEKMISTQPLEFCFSEGSALSVIYENHGYVLMLGTDHRRNTSMHLGEHRANFPGQFIREYAAAMMVDGVREWAKFRDIEYNDELFPEIGKDWEKEEGLVRIGKVGQAECRLMPQRELVDYTIQWLEERAGDRIKGYSAG